MTEATLEQNMNSARHEHLRPGRELHLRDMRGRWFCEVGLITGTSRHNAVANIWNTAGACDPTPEQFDVLDADAIASANAAMGAWRDPARRWLADRIDVREAGDDKDFGGITGTWVKVVGAATLPETGRGCYHPAYSRSTTTFTFTSGSRVYLLDAPDGEVFVLQSVSQHFGASLTEGDLARLHRWLSLPQRWGFRAEVLDQDLAVSSNPDDLAHLLQDELQNVYLGSDVGRAFSHLTPQDSLW